MNRVQKFKLILWTITGLAAAVGITRFIFGLGVTTNLTDSTPWGLWIGFDVMGGVALAGGGFVLTAIFYIMKREEFHPLVRPAVLTAFLGYLAVMGGLIFDLGLPWNFWHMIIHWNFHSPLFEVGWCVMLYSGVLLLEFSPVPLEETSRYARIRSFLLRFRFPLVLLGIMLSTLHQSSLGSLFLIMPHKLHPLWYSKILPVQFFISAVALGLMMVAFESHFSHWLYGRKPETKLVRKLGRAAVWVLLVYLAVKLTDLIINGDFALIFTGSRESILFIIEILLSVIIPIIIFSIPRFRDDHKWQRTGAFLAVFGIVFNRINVGGLAMLSATGDSYVPSWTEIIISLGVVSTAALAFLFAVEKFHIWEKRPRHPEADPYAAPQFDRVSHVWLGSPPAAARIKYSLVFILGFAAGFALMPGSKILSRGIEQVPVIPARGGSQLFIDGNNNKYGVVFNHQKHVDINGGEASCSNCHHMNLPLDKNSRCAECHRLMYAEADIFRHDWHASPAGANIPCRDCHEQDMKRVSSSTKDCVECHADLKVSEATVQAEGYMAPAYIDAMHDMCIKCHKQKAPELEGKERLAECGNCHTTPRPEDIKIRLRYDNLKEDVNRVVLPGTSIN